jgi:hypothetical protein
VRGHPHQHPKKQKGVYRPFHHHSKNQKVYIKQLTYRYGYGIVYMKGSAEMEIVEYLTKGREAKAARGGYAGGRVPYGYYVEYGRLEIDDNEAAVIRLIFDMRAAGWTYKRIAEKLSEYGIVARGGEPMIFTTVRAILEKRKLYEGYYRYGDMEWVKGEHEAIL